jgi:hypothetical protein
MTSSSGGVGLGARVLAPTLEVTPGNGSGGQGDLIYRAATQLYCPHVVSAGLAQTTQTLTNGGSGGYGEFHIRLVRAGSLVDGWTVDSGRTAGVISLYPRVDNTMQLGAASYRPTVLFAVSGTINTSDANEKQQIQDLDEAELRVAVRIKQLVKKFKFNDAVADKGDKARIHVGVVAQEVQSAFIAEGLDPHRYAMFCQDTWYELDGDAVSPDDDGNYPEGAAKRTRMGIRYEQLLAFVLAAL